MAQCVASQTLAVEGGQIEVLAVVPGPCTQAVLLSPAEYSRWLDSPLNLSVEDGSQIAGAILAVWAIAWVARAIVRSLDVDGESLE